MIYTQQLYSIALLGVWEAGIVDKERVVLRAIDSINIGFFALTTGWRGSSYSDLSPLRDSAFWFPDRLVKPADWIILYTGRGEAKETQLVGTSQTAYTYHWNREQTVFNFGDLVPVLFQIAGCLTVPNNPGQLTLDQQIRKLVEKEEPSA